MGRRPIRAVAVLVAALVLVAAGSALAVKKVTKVNIVVGDIVVKGEGGFTPTALPKNVDAPITLWGRGNISTVSGEYPPVLKTIEFEFDKHGSVDTLGLPKCSLNRLVATTVPQARRLCPGSIIGTGTGRAVVKFPEQAPIDASSPITLFNGPQIGGDPTVYAHAYLTVGGPTTFIVPIRIEKIRNGRYGYRVNVEIPRIAGGYGIPLAGSIRVGRKWTFKGKKHSFVNARCPDGRLQAIGEFGFKDGSLLKGTFVSPCQTRG